MTEDQPLLDNNKKQQPYYRDQHQNEYETSPDHDNNDGSSPISIPCFVYWMAAVAALNSCNVGFDIGVNSPAGILLQRDLDMTDLELEIFNGSINLFAVVGALTSAWLVKQWGMRVAFFCSSAGFVAGMLLILVADKFGTKMMLGRTLLGWCVGVGFAITPQYLSEISPRQSRGFFASWSEIGCNVGIVLGFFTGVVFPSHWRRMFATGCILPSIMMVLSLTVLVESPRWLARQGKLEESSLVLQKLYRDKDMVPRILDDIIKDMEHERQLHAQQGWSFLWNPAYRKPLLLGIGIAIGHELCGIDAIQYYLSFIMEASGIAATNDQAKILLGLGVLKLACLFVASALVDRLGRRPLMMGSICGMTLALSVLANNFLGLEDDHTTTTTGKERQWRVVEAGLAIFLCSFSLGMGPLGWVMPPELFSTTIRSKAIALTTFCNRSTSTVMTGTMLSLAHALTWSGYFWLLAAINVSLGLLAFAFLPETKGRKLEGAIQ